MSGSREGKLGSNMLRGSQLVESFRSENQSNMPEGVFNDRSRRFRVRCLDYTLLADDSIYNYGLW